jgi:hypothetical protein
MLTDMQFNSFFEYELLEKVKAGSQQQTMFYTQLNPNRSWKFKI